MSGSFLPERAGNARSWTPGERLAGRLPDPDPVADAPTIGVLALQGDVIEHVRALRRCGANVVQVRSAAQLAGVAGLVVPGGESTTIGKLLTRFDLLGPVRSRIDQGLPVFGTCAGMILLSDELDQVETQPLLGGLHVRTRRNAFGGQRESFDTRIEVAGIEGGPIDVAFIRAPRVEAVLSDDVEVLAEVAGYPVVVRQGHLLAAAFHPEVSGDDRLHAAFVRLVRSTAVTGPVRAAAASAPSR